MRIAPGPSRPSRSARATAKGTARPAPKKKAADGFGPSASRAFDLTSTLHTASQVRRGSGPEGSEALLTQVEQARVRTLFGALAPDPSRALQKVLLSVTEPAHQAVLLKAIAARASRLRGSDTRVLPLLQRFAKLIAPLSVETLLERATVLDLDSRNSTASDDPMTMWGKQGTIREPAGEGAAKDNDGLFQRFTATCGPTVIQMIRAQADPVLAFAINASGRTRDASRGEVAHFQKALLEEYGGLAVPRRESFVLSRLHNAFAKLKLPDRRLSDANIEKVRAKYAGFPSAEDLKRVRAAVIPARDEGISADDFRKMLDHYVGNLTGAKYTMTSPEAGYARGQAYRGLDAAEKALKQGYDVPFGVVQPDHWMVITHVRGKAPDREWLVSDPDGGRTDWVSEKALVSGSFGVTPFKLPKPGERPYIDCFFLPTFDA